MPRFFRLAHKHFTHKSFSNILGMRNVLYLEPKQQNFEDPVEFVYSVPNRMCRIVAESDIDNVPTTKSLFTIGPIMAIMDELSTYGFMLKDANKRGGVSVYLSGRVFQHPCAGDTLIVSTKITKIGKSLGFCDINVTSSDSNVADRVRFASGYHIKFLPAGLLWNVLTHKHVSEFILPHLEKVNLDVGRGELANETLLSRAIRYIIRDKNRPLKPGEPVPENDASIVEKDLPGALYERLQHRLVSVDMATGSDSSSSSDSDADPAVSSGSHSFQFKVGREYSNILGNLHGGLVAINAEETVLRRLNNTNSGSWYCDQNSRPRFVTELHVKYLAPMRGDVCFNTEDCMSKLTRTDEEYPHRCQPAVATGSVTKRNKKGIINTCAQFECVLSE